MKLAKEITSMVDESINEGKKENLIAFIKQQLGVDLAPLVDDRHSKKFTYMNVDFDQLGDIEQRRIQSLAHSSKKFRIEDNGGLGKAFYFIKE